MTKYCCAPGCLNVLNQNKNITFHRFPHKRPDILEKWILATKIKNFEANLFAMICSEHFTPDCYTENNLHRKILKKEAIPTIFKINEKMKNCNKPDIKESESCSSVQVNNEVDKQHTITNVNSDGDDIGYKEKGKINNCQSAEKLIKDGWFQELGELCSGQGLALKVDEVLCSEKSDYHEIMVVQTANHGKTLIMDGTIQCTEKDEFAYKEMITFLPLCAHPNPENILIMGGGDGGVAREVDKYPSVKKVVQVELDQNIIDISKKYLSNTAKGFDSTKLNLQISDGLVYLKEHKEEFDVIITDCEDKFSATNIFFTESYFALLKEALRPNGIICSKGGSVWSDIDRVNSVLSYCRKYFKEVRYPVINLPTYPTGQIGFFMASLNENIDLTTPKLRLTNEELEKYNLNYYNSELHSACFILPNFAKKDSVSVCFQQRRNSYE